MEDIFIGQTFQLSNSHKPTTSIFRITKSLGQNRNKVFLATTKAQNKITIKIPDTLDDFKAESRLLHLSHPHLATPTASGKVSKISNSETEHILENLDCLTMEYCPNGDFVNLINSEKSHLLKDKVVRTYFHQLVSAVEYLHDNGIAHGDIKLDNMFLDKKFQLKLSDFDLSFMAGDQRISSGSPNYRAPEVLLDNYDGFKADVFAMGVVLFVLTNRNFLPFDETQAALQELLYSDRKKYWDLMVESRKLQGLKGNIWNEEFKELFEGMTRKNPKERFGIKEIKESKWYKGEILSKVDLKNLMKRASFKA